MTSAVSSSTPFISVQRHVPSTAERSRLRLGLLLGDGTVTCRIITNGVFHGVDTSTFSGHFPTATVQRLAVAAARGLRGDRRCHW